jgi:hypothetical protein
MALLAKTNNTIATIGRNIPIPFSETRTVSLCLVNDIQTIPIKLNLKLYSMPEQIDSVFFYETTLTIESSCLNPKV